MTPATQAAGPERADLRHVHRRTARQLGSRDEGAARGQRHRGWTRHDLRRTGATMLGEMGELPDIIEAALNHVSIRSPLAATYNRSRYRPQVAAALQRLADALDGIEAGAARWCRCALDSDRARVPWRGRAATGAVVLTARSSLTDWTQCDASSRIEPGR